MANLPRENKVLIVRLSALGDLILATSCLEYLPPRSQIDWVVGSGFAEILDGHPRLHKVWGFERKSGLLGWLRLGKELYHEDYSAVFDLHSTLRSFILRTQFRLLDLIGGRRRKICSLKKQRWRLWGYFIFKKLWPVSLRPRHVLTRIGESMVGSEPAFPKMPDLRYLASKSTPAVDDVLKDKKYYALMPSSKWGGKEWSADKFRDLIESIPTAGVPVVLGRRGDKKSERLVATLVDADIEHISGLDRWTLGQTARVLARAKFVIAVDTGIAHLAQALGVPTLVIFGPTTPDMGFGPWAPKSKSHGLDLNCRPCGKDGRICQRFWQPYHCLRGLGVGSTLSALKEITSLEVREFPKV